jgi:peptidoglycan/LPS O-acetylase OafA/YrhL
MVVKLFAYWGHPFHLIAGKFQFVGYMAMTVILAIISWEIYEKQVLKLKKYFEYTK